MEGVPRMPMLSFELKSCSESIAFTPALKSYISEFYHEDPETYTKECSELDQLRQSAVQVTVDFVGCSLLKKYYSQLHFVQSRFPISDGDSIVIPFTWEDPFTRRPVSVTDIKFEMSCILYNIGALHSILGGMDSRQSPEGMKVSCTHFQCAAWAFQQLRDNFDSNSSPDMNHSLLTFQSNIMLAQGQECILEKSMTDSRKSSITAKVAAQIVEYYKLALKNLDASNCASFVGSKKVKDWRKRAELKINFYDCITLFYLGLCSEEQQKWGERVTYCQAAVDRLNESMQLVNKSDHDAAAIGESLRFAMDVAGGKFNSAKKDNDFVYHDKIPAFDTLPEIKGASLVKGIPFNPNDPEVSGPDIFKKLVPLEAHKASSLYSEEKAKLLRRITTKIEEKNQELSAFMSSLQLDSSLHIIPEPQKLPQTLVEKCAAISVRPNAIKDLVDAMQSLSGIATDVEVSIHEIQTLLDEEDKQEKEFQKIAGGRHANVIVGELHSDCAKYQEGLVKAAQSNEELHRAMEVHIANLRLLSQPLTELQKTLPSSAEIPRAADDEATMQEMKRLCDKITEMQKQRQMFEQQFRDELLKDDLTATLVTHADKNQEELFQDELGKHSKTISLIEQNLTAQDNILHALTDTNAKYARIRKENTETSNKREAKIAELITSFTVYEDLLTKVNRGRQFYDKLEAKVRHLLERTHRVCRAEQEERSRIRERLAPKAAPPERPTAPKPVHQQQLPAAAFELPPDAVLGSPGSFGQPSMMGIPQLPSSEAPKLKDFLPFMKPGSFGPKAQAGSHLPTVSNDCAPGGAGSLPASVSASPVHLPRAPVSFPPSPQRQPPVSLPMSNGYGEMPSTAGTGFVQAEAGYPVADVLLSPTAPPGAPRSASPAHQQPSTVAHPGGPAESHHQPLMPYNIPQNYSSAAAGIGIEPVITGSHAGAPGQNGRSSNSQVIGQPPVISSPMYSR